MSAMEADCYSKSFILSLPFVAIKLMNTSLKLDQERDGITKASLSALAIALGKMTHAPSILFSFDYYPRCLGSLVTCAIAIYVYIFLQKLAGSFKVGFSLRVFVRDIFIVFMIM